MMDYRRQIRLVLFSVVAQAVFFSRNILILPILTRVLGPEQYGLWSKLHSLSNLLVPVIGLGIVEGCMRYFPAADNRERGRLLSAAASLTLAGGAVCVLFLLMFSSLLIPLIAAENTVEFLSVGMLAALGVMVACKGLYIMAWHAFRFAEKSKGCLLLVSMHLVLLVGGALYGWKIFGRSQWVAVCAWGGSCLIAGGVALYFLLKEYGAELKREVFAKTLRYGAPLIPAPALFWVLHCADRYMIPWLRPDLGDGGVGVYSANYAVGGLIAMAFAPFWLFYRPVALRLWDEGRAQDASHFTKQTAKFSLVAMLGVALACPVLSDYGMRFIAGAGFSAVLPVMLFVMAGYILHMLSQLPETALMMERRTVEIFLYTSFAAAANVALNYILIPSPQWFGGLTGAALATAGGFLIYIFLLTVASKRVKGFSCGIHICLRVLACSAPSGSVVFLWKSADLKQSLLALFAALVLYAVVLLLTSTVKRSEIAAVYAAVTRR